MEVDSGSVLYNGRDFSKMNRKERKDIRKEIGMLFQGSALFDSMSVEENIMFPLKMFTNMSKKEMQERADFCLERVNLSGRNKSEEHTSELQSRPHLVCRLLLEK